MATVLITLKKRNHRNIVVSNDTRIEAVAQKIIEAELDSRALDQGLRLGVVAAARASQTHRER